MLEGNKHNINIIFTQINKIFNTYTFNSCLRDGSLSIQRAGYGHEIFQANAYTINFLLEYTIHFAKS